MSRSVEDKKLCHNHGPTPTSTTKQSHHHDNNQNSIINNNNGTSSGFEFHTTSSSTNNHRSHGHRSAALGIGKLSAPSKWDDAQKWLVNLSRDRSTLHKTVTSSSLTKPRDSNADDLRLIAPIPPKDYEEEEEEEEKEIHNNSSNNDDASVADEVAVGVVTWRVTKSNSKAVRSVCVRDMGTEMTPIASQEPSRTATPIRATTPVARSPVSSACSTPIHGYNGNNNTNVVIASNNTKCEGDKDDNNSESVSPLETRAVAWDEAERAKYMARYKREEVKIQAWENHEKRKAEMEMKKMEVKAERMKTRAEEKMTNKLAATRRIAEEKRANAETKLNEKAMKTSERADYIRRTGHLPSSFSFKLPSLNCW